MVKVIGFSTIPLVRVVYILIGEMHWLLPPNFNNTIDKENIGIIIEVVFTDFKIIILLGIVLFLADMADEISSVG